MGSRLWCEGHWWPFQFARSLAGGAGEGPTLSELPFLLLRNGDEPSWAAVRTGGTGGRDAACSRRPQQAPAPTLPTRVGAQQVGLRPSCTIYSLCGKSFSLRFLA